MKYVLLVFLFFSPLCCMAEDVSNKIEIDSEVLAKFDWQYREESDVWVKIAAYGDKEITVLVEKITVWNHADDTPSPSLQFTLTISCGHEMKPMLLTWMHDGSFADATLCDDQEGKMKLPPVFERAIYPLPPEALDYLAGKPEN